MFKIFNRGHKPQVMNNYASVEETNKRYQHYLDTTTEDYMARRGDVFVMNPHTMPGNAYKELRNSIDGISILAKDANKQVIFEDARHLHAGDEFASEKRIDDLGKKVLVSVVDKKTGDEYIRTVDYFDNGEENLPFMDRIFKTLGDMFNSDKK